MRSRWDHDDVMLDRFPGWWGRSPRPCAIKDFFFFFFFFSHSRELFLKNDVISIESVDYDVICSARGGTLAFLGVWGEITVQKLSIISRFWSRFWSRFNLELTSIWSQYDLSLISVWSTIDLDLFISLLRMPTVYVSLNPCSLVLFSLFSLERRSWMSLSYTKTTSSPARIDPNPKISQVNTLLSPSFPSSLRLTRSHLPLLSLARIANGGERRPHCRPVHQRRYW